MSNKNYVISKAAAINVPTPSSLSYASNFGSLLGVFLSVQLISGLVLSFHFSSSISEAFESVVSICDDISSGWVVRSIHANGASFFFIFLFLHLGRGLLYKSFLNSKATWIVGVTIFLLLMATAFLGYVLPWGQISFWGATVITNLLSTLPWGSEIVTWVWGGFSVSGPTLSRFFSLHYILPFVVAVLSAVHIVTLHSKGSENPLGLSNDADKVYFHPLFTVNDLVGVILISLLFVSVALICPDMFMDPDNFTEANPISTPPHIQPEWYFLFAYAILRSIPSNLGGVVALASSIVVLYLLPSLSRVNSGSSKLVKQLFFWALVGVFFLLTWTGSIPVEGPMVIVGQLLSVLYFFLIFVIGVI